jgi:hypothetical protein
MNNFKPTKKAKWVTAISVLVLVLLAIWGVVLMTSGNVSKPVAQPIQIDLPSGEAGVGTTPTPTLEPAPAPAPDIAPLCINQSNYSCAVEFLAPESVRCYAMRMTWSEGISSSDELQFVTGSSDSQFTTGYATSADECLQQFHVLTGLEEGSTPTPTWGSISATYGGNNSWVCSRKEGGFPAPDGVPAEWCVTAFAELDATGSIPVAPSSGPDLSAGATPPIDSPIGLDYASKPSDERSPTAPVLPPASPQSEAVEPVIVPVPVTPTPVTEETSSQAIQAVFQCVQDAEILATVRNSRECAAVFESNEQTNAPYPIPGASSIQIVRRFECVQDGVSLAVVNHSNECAAVFGGVL